MWSRVVSWLPHLACDPKIDSQGVRANPAKTTYCFLEQEIFIHIGGPTKRTQK